jgi:hypothetical protein
MYLLQAELAFSARALALEQGEAAAARETAQQATQQLHAALRSHQAEVEGLQNQIRQLTVSCTVQNRTAHLLQGKDTPQMQLLSFSSRCPCIAACQPTT